MNVIGTDAALESARETTDPAAYWKTRCLGAEQELSKLNAYLQLIGDSAPFGIFTIDDQGRVTGRNQKAREMFVWPSDQDRMDLPIREIPFLATFEMEREVTACMGSGKRRILDHPCYDPSGQCLHVRFYFSPMRHPDNSLAGVIVFAEDMTLIRLANEAAADSLRRYHLLFQFSPVPMIERDATELKRHLNDLNGRGIVDIEAYLTAHPEEILRCMGMIRTLDINHAMVRLLDADSRDALTQYASRLQSEEFLQLGRDVIVMIAKGTVSQEKERSILTIKNERKIVLVRTLLVSGHEEALSRIIMALVDITKRKEAEDALRQSENKFREMAFRDNLTGLFNRRYLYQTLPLLMERSRSEKGHLSLIFMDLDNFKRVVDTHGHLNGSLAIREAAAIVRDALEKPAYAVAYAGDEFVVVLPGAGTQAAVERAKAIRSAIADAVFLVSEGLAVKLQASLGIATFPDHATDLTGLLASADKALFEVKGKGKGALGVYQP